MKLLKRMVPAPGVQTSGIRERRSSTGQSARTATRAPAYALSLVFLARLAVDHRFEGKGLGRLLLREPFRISRLPVAASSLTRMNKRWLVMQNTASFRLKEVVKPRISSRRRLFSAPFIA
jgi:hypothetical protein